MLSICLQQKLKAKEAVCGMQHSFECIAKIYNDYDVRFGIPRQSGIVEEVESKIIFEPGYRSKEAVRGLSEYTHIWLIWLFSETEERGFRPTVRPPRLGGNKRVGVFATRSPFRPNPVGLSCVTLKRVDLEGENGPVIYVKGADIMSGTPLFDIKPYLPYTDCRPEASGGFTDGFSGKKLAVSCNEELVSGFDSGKIAQLFKILEQDPRPGYHNEPDRVYSFEFAGMKIRFTVKDDVLTICGIS